MGMVKGEKSKRIIRAVKTLFFLIALLISFLLFSAPVLLAAADAVLPSAILSAYLSSSFLSPRTLAAYLANYDFRYSLIDIPLISIVRSILIICVYSCCDGPRLSRGPHLWAASTCSLLSLVFVSLKASFVFGGNIGNLSTGGGLGEREGCVIGAEVALFVCSCALAIGHVMVAYRTCCRERKKLLVYKIDIEAANYISFNLKEIGSYGLCVTCLLRFLLAKMRFLDMKRWSKKKGRIKKGSCDILLSEISSYLQ